MITRCVIGATVVTMILIGMGWPALEQTLAQIQLPQMPQILQMPQIPEMGTLATPSTPVITTPRPGAMLASPISVKGTTSSGAKVTATAILQVPVPFTSVTSRLAETTTNADAKGNWEASLSYRIPMKVSGAEVVIKAVAANTVTGQKSAAAQVVIKPRQ
jgi:hypothetical protein